MADEPLQEGRSRIKVARNAKGFPQWEVSVVAGETDQELNRIADAAVSQYRRLGDMLGGGVEVEASAADETGGFAAEAQRQRQEREQPRDQQGKFAQKKKSTPRRRPRPKAETAVGDERSQLALS